MRWLLCVFLFVTSVWARPFEVRARSRLEAHAERRGGTLQVRGSLLDDGSAPLRRQSIAFATSAQVTLTRCEGTGEVDAVETDNEGHFCIALRGAKDAFRLTFAFKGTPSIEGSAFELAIDPGKRTLSIRIAPTPLLIALDDQIWKLEALVEGQDVGAASPEPGIELLLLSDDRNELARETSDATGRIAFRLDPMKLGLPGEGTLSIRYHGSDTIAPVDMHFPVERRAKVRLVAGVESMTVGRTESVKALWRGGAVTIGSVEARSGGLPIGSAPLDALGIAALALTATGAAEGEPGSATIRYVPQSRIFEAGDTLPVAVIPAPKSYWGHLASLMLLVGMVVWTVRLRVRPRKAPVKDVEEDRPEPVLDVLAKSTEPVWSGTVIDRHTLLPLANVSVRVVAPAFTEAPTLAATTTDASGAFVLQMREAAPGVHLLFEGPLHTELTLPAPAFGTLRIHMTTRRRSVLARFLRVVKPTSAQERTPSEVAKESSDPEVAAWAARVEEAVYSHVPVDREREERVGKPPRV